MLKVTVTLTFDLLTPKSIGIIYEPWPFIKSNNYGVPKHNRFQVIDRTRILCLKGHCDLDLWPTDPKIIRVHLWVMAIHDTKKDLPMWNKFEVNEQRDC